MWKHLLSCSGNAWKGEILFIFLHAGEIENHLKVEPLKEIVCSFFFLEIMWMKALLLPSSLISSFSFYMLHWPLNLFFLSF